jgi:hypothetical protein
MKKLISSAIVLAAMTAAASPAYADGGLGFQIAGDTFGANYTITNTSTAGEFVTGFGVTLRSPFGFDTVDGGFGVDGSLPFSPVGGSGVLTGYTGPSSFVDGTPSLNFTFTNFGVGKSFIWNIDVDQPNIATVLGSDLIGSTGYADFSNGLRGLGTFQALGTNGSQFVINTFTAIPAVPEPATWGMMILGFGLIGAAARSRKTKTSVAFA